MRRFASLGWVFGVSLLGLSAVRAQTEYTADGSPTGLEEEIRWRVNRGRFDAASENQKRGTAYTDVPASAGPLAPNESLTLAARHQSEDMARNNVFQHATVTGSAYYDPITEPSPWDRMRAEGYTFTTAAENIAAGYSGAEAVYIAWWNSAGHRVNMYNNGLREVGLGYYYWSASSYRNYYTMDLGSSGNSCFVTDTLFWDANNNGIYDQTEGISNVVVSLLVGNTPQTGYDMSSPVGSFAVPLANIPSGAAVQVVFSNTTSSTVTLSVPEDYQRYATVILSPGERRVYGTFVRAPGALNVGLRELAPLSPPGVSSRLNIQVKESAVTVTWPSVSGLAYQLQTSANLVLWSTLKDWQAGTGSEMAVVDSAPNSGAEKFYRLLTKQP